MRTIQQWKQSTHWYMPVPKHRVIISKSVKKTKLPQRHLYSSCRATIGILLCQFFCACRYEWSNQCMWEQLSCVLLFLVRHVHSDIARNTVWPLVCCWFLLTTSICLRALSSIYFCKFSFAVFHAPFHSISIYWTQFLCHEIAALDCYQENMLWDYEEVL